MLYISMKIRDTILNDFQVIERTRNYNCQISKGNNSKKYIDKIYDFVVCMSSDDAIYFCEVSWIYLERFQVIERTRNDHCQISKGNNSKDVFTRNMVLKLYGVHCLRWNCLNTAIVWMSIFENLQLGAVINIHHPGRNSLLRYLHVTHVNNTRHY